MKKKKDFDTQNKNISEDFSEQELSMLHKGLNSAEIDRSKLPPHDTSDKGAFIRFIRGNKLLAATSIFIALALVAAVIIGCFALGKFIIDSSAKYTYNINGEQKYEISRSEAVKNGILYIDMRKIATSLDMTVSGSATSVQFTSKNGSSVYFEDGSKTAKINRGETTIIARNLNGKRVKAKAYVSKSECLVPFTFLTEIISDDTATLRFDAEKKTVSVKAIYTDKSYTQMEEVLFITDNFEVEMPETEKPTFTYNYAIDVSEYVASLDSEYLMLVNKTHHISADDVPEDLIELTCPTATSKKYELRYDAAVALTAMMTEMKKAGINDTYVTSAYRDYEYQQNLYNKYVKGHMNNDGMTLEEAEEAASKYSARPGESEHQTGLSIDFTTTSMGGALDERFEDTEAFEWLSENAHKYGFILRYPKDKTGITNYALYEPWHYRFVGRQAASEMHLWNMCLEEYLGEYD